MKLARLIQLLGLTVWIQAEKVMGGSRKRIASRLYSTELHVVIHLSDQTINPQSPS